MFACLVFTNQNGDMDIKEIRRLRLKDWFSDKTLPEREKSYLSQLINGKGSFGERAARRIEADYGMPVGYLDKNYEHGKDGEPLPPEIVLDEQEKKLISLFREFPASEKNEMIELFTKKNKEFSKLFEELLQARGKNSNIKH